MADDRVIIVDDQGQRHIFPAGFDPKKAGEIVRQQTAPKWNEPGGDVLLDSARMLAGVPGRVMKFIGNHPVESAATAGALAAVPFTGGGSLAGLGPLVPILAAAGGGAGGAGVGMMAKAARGDADTPNTAAKVVGEMGKQGAIQGAGEAGGQVLGGVLRKVAPNVMDTALWRTRAQRLEFPNTPSRLVSEGIVPTEGNIAGALDETEKRLMERARTFDASRPPVRGLLPEATTDVPLGARPTPQGGAGTLTPANRTPIQAQFHVMSGEPTGAAAGDVVEGAGTVRQPMNAPPGRGAPPNMVDPEQLADSAREYAWKEGKVGDLGDVPGEDADAIDRAREQYLRENTRPRNLEETIGQKRAYQQRSSYNNQPNAKPSPNAHANFDKGVASANREAALKLDPELGADLSREQDLIGADTALGYTNNRGTPLLSGGIARHFLLRPAPVGASAIALDRAGRALTNPAAIRAAILAAMTGDEGDGSAP